MNSARKLLFVINSGDFFLSHRLPIALAARAHGFQVVIVTAGGDAAGRISQLGFDHRSLPLTRSGTHPLIELRTLMALWKLFREIRPDLVHLVTIKPVLYGGLIARLVGVPGVLVAVSGLGTVFSGSAVGNSWRRRLVEGFYRVALKQRNLKAVFQNTHDLEVLSGIGAVRAEDAILIRGSGVDLEQCRFVSEPDSVHVVVMAARLLREKGVFEFIEAARLLSQRGIEACFRLIGSPDPGNPHSVTGDQLAKWKSEGVVEVLGFRADVPAEYAKAHVVCLPSYYGEGLPKSLIEAAACGRPVITTNMPGCRDAIEPDVTGLLVPPMDPIALANAIQALLVDREKRRKMGVAGRRLAEEEFAVEKVVEQHLKIYAELLSNA